MPPSSTDPYSRPHGNIHHPHAGSPKGSARGYGDLSATSSEQFSWDSRLRGNDEKNSPVSKGAWGIFQSSSSLKPNKLKPKAYWFTLVELIVVITILVILGTIAFISLNGYSRSARDSARISTVAAMRKGLQINLQKTSTYPMPDSPYLPIFDPTDHVTIIGYQWEAGSGVTTLANIHGDTKDPKDRMSYTYSVGKDQKRAQFLGFLEEGGTFSIGYEMTPPTETTFAATGTVDLSDRHPFVQWDPLGILLSSTGSNINQPIQYSGLSGVDLGSGTLMSGYTAYLSESSGSVSGTGIAEIIAPLYNPSATCGSADGANYLAAPSGTALCNIGTSTGATNISGSWKWSCDASNGTHANCTATVASASPAACGTATSVSTATAPSTNLCTSPATPTTVTLSWGIAKWVWNCNDAGGSSLASCSATALTSGACSTPPANAIFYNNTNSYSLSGATFGTSQTPSYNATPTANTCEYKCSTGYTHSAGSCVPVTNGQCGTASSTITSTAVSFAPPTSSLCAVGNIAVSGTATPLSSSVGYTYQGSVLKWTWSCNSPNGGTNASCSVPSVSYTQWQDYYSPHINSIISQNSWANGSDSFTSVGSGVPPTHSSVLAQNGKIYAFPGNGYGDKIYSFNPSDNSVNILAAGVGQYGLAVLSPTGKIYLPPQWAGNVMVLNTVNDSISYIGSGLKRYDGAILAPNGKIYAVSCGSPGYGCDGATDSDILVIDPSNDSISHILGGQITSAGYGWNLALGPNGKIYMKVWGVGTAVWVIDTATDTLSTFAGACYVAWGFKIGWNGILYAFGYNACSISVDTSINTTTNLWGGIWMCGGMQLWPNGIIYGTPCSSPVTYYSIGGAAPTNISGSPSGYHNGFVTASNGKMYAFPRHSSYTTIIVLTPGGTTQHFNTNTLLSPYINSR